LKPWALKNVLLEKYRFKPLEVDLFSDFLLKMLKWEPKERASAREMLSHPWLKMIDNYNAKMGKVEVKEYKMIYKMSVSSSSDSHSSSSKSEGSESSGGEEVQSSGGDDENEQ
jgi:serine/threonine protein kinase